MTTMEWIVTDSLNQANSCFASPVGVCSRANVFLASLSLPGVHWRLWKCHLWNCHELHTRAQAFLEWYHFDGWTLEECKPRLAEDLLVPNGWTNLLLCFSSQVLLQTVNQFHYKGVSYIWFQLFPVNHEGRTYQISLYFEESRNGLQSLA